jgi:hypothetical protein
LLQTSRVVELSFEFSSQKTPVRVCDELLPSPPEAGKRTGGFTRLIKSGLEILSCA